MKTIAISCTTGICALLSSCLSRRKGARGEIGVARNEWFNIQRQKRREEQGDDGKRPFAAFHDRTPFSRDASVAFIVLSLSD
jgi:hypothetical protein